MVGYVPEEPHLYTYLTGPEYLRLIDDCAAYRRLRSTTRSDIIVLDLGTLARGQA